MKHGVRTVGKGPIAARSGRGRTAERSEGPPPAQPSRRAKMAMTALTFAILGGALLIITQLALP